MNRKGLYSVFIVVAVMAALLILTGHPVQADDELLLTGIVKSIDPAKGIIFVDVKSSSCPGMRKFRIDDAGEKDNFIGKKIEFMIDSSTCRDSEVHKMIPPGEFK